MGDGVRPLGIAHMIESVSNRQMKNLVQLQTKAKVRREQKLFVTEGVRMFREVPKELLVKTYVSHSFLQKEENRALVAGCGAEEVSDAVFARASDTKTPQGVLCVVRQKEYSLADLLRTDAPFLLLLEELQDPGNLGTIFRTAEAAGADGLVISGSADVYSPKTVRSTMGALYRMPFVCVQDFDETLKELKARKIITYAAHLKGEGAYTQKDYRTGCAFMIGNEGSGLSQTLASRADAYVKIPMCGQAESLNAAVAAAVLMYEVRRQRDLL